MRLRLSFPAYFLVGHAIELSLKAFLLGRKVGVAELRSRKYGHNLEALLRQSRRRQIGREVPLNMKEVQAVLLLNECYCAKELEYVVVSLRSLPSYALIHTGRLNSTRAFCRMFNASAPNPSIERTRSGSAGLAFISFLAKPAPPPLAAHVKR